MPATAVFTGLIRNPGLFSKTLEDLDMFRREGVIDRVVVSTWRGELDTFPWIRDVLRRVDACVVEVEPIAVDTYRNYRRQQALLDRGLDAAEGWVIKLRPDWHVRRETLRALAAPTSPIAAPPGIPSPFEGKLRIPWWSTRVPYHLADESVTGFKADLRATNPRAEALALADPHAAKYLPAMSTIFPLLRFVGLHILKHITDSTRDDVRTVRTLGGKAHHPVARRVLQKRGPFRFGVTDLALALPTYQRAVATYVVSLPWFFEIVNPAPKTDQFIDRHGPWSYFVADVTECGDPFQNPDPVCYRSPEKSSVVSRVPATFRHFHEAVEHFRADPAAMGEEPDPDEIERDLRTLRQRLWGERIPRLAREMLGRFPGIGPMFRAATYG